MSSPAPPSSAGHTWPDAPTDPGLDAVESLFRGGTGRSGLRAFEPALRPPEGIRDHSWLYRPDEAVPTPARTRSGSSGSSPALLTTTSGPVALAPPLVRWSPGTRAVPRRWPAAALLAVALTCALLLPWVLAAR